MKDSYGRSIEYLRISVTDRCNLRCAHCMPPEGVPLLTHADILSYEEIAVVAEQAAVLGIRKVRLTGGEALVRPGLSSLVSLLKAVPGIESLQLTTNAVLLKEQLPALLDAGLDGVNISLNALDRDAYLAFTGRDCFDAAMEGLQAALDALGLRVKVNCVPTRGREEQLVRLASLARDTRASVRFIELMPIGRGTALQGLSRDEMLALLNNAYGTPVPSTGSGTTSVTLAGPAEYVRFPGFCSDIGFISAVSCRFCEYCNRIRLTADGKLKSCLAYPAGEDVRAILRSDGKPEDLKAALERCILSKPQNHQFGSESTQEDRLMSQIGG